MIYLARQLALWDRHPGAGVRLSWTILADQEDNEFCVLSPR